MRSTAVIFSILIGIVSGDLYSQNLIQPDKTGIIVGIGLGMGFSKHADSYFIEERFRTKEFSGFRAMALDLKAGWGINNHILLFGTSKMSPSNTTISPYRSIYNGGGVAINFPSNPKVYWIGGLGHIRTGVEKGKKMGTGTMVNLGVSIEMIPHLMAEVNTLFGRIKNTTDLDPYPYSKNEFYLQMTLSYLIY